MNAKDSKVLANFQTLRLGLKAEEEDLNRRIQEVNAVLEALFSKYKMESQRLTGEDGREWSLCRVEEGEQTRVDSKKFVRKLIELKVDPATVSKARERASKSITIPAHMRLAPVKGGSKVEGEED